MLALILALPSCRPSVPPAPRNLLIIAIDTVRYDSFLAEGLADDFTPWIERAQVYDNAIAPAPWTIPSVASLFTGKYPIEHGAGRFQGEVKNLDADLPSPLAPEFRTMAEILDSHYFRTGAFVSHPFFAANLGLEQGFQVRHNRRGWWRDYAAYRKWADRIEAPHRIFGYLHFMEAHHRHTREDPELEEFLAEYDETGRQALTERSTPQACSDEDSRHCRQNMVYNASILELRKGIASILDDLAQRGLLDETLVLLYSDHGEEFWDHEEVQTHRGEDPRGTFGFGHGQSMFQELLRVPLMVWHPAIPGARHEDLVSLVDVLPSVLAWLDLEEPGLEVSGDLLPPLRGGLWDSPEDRTVWSSGIAYGPEQIATRNQHMKSIFSLRDERFEFFDLLQDPLERAPLDDDSLVMAFDTLTGDYMDMKQVGMLASSELDSGQLEDLKAIGYLQGVESEAPEEEPEEEKHAEEQAKDDAEHEEPATADEHVSGKNVANEHEEPERP
jgi:arylsulfatase A-like enzyme